MISHRETVAWQGDRPVVSSAVGIARPYQNLTLPGNTISSADLAAAIIAARYRITLPVARLICTLSGIGGQAQ